MSLPSDPNISQILADATAAQSELTTQAATIAADTEQIASLQSSIVTLEGRRVWMDLHRQMWKVALGPVANTGAVGNVATPSQTLPGLHCATRTCNPKGQDGANTMFYLQLGADDTKTTFVYSGSYMFPSKADAVAIQAKENDFQQVALGRKFDWGWQFDFAVSGLFRVWNPTAEAWEATSITAPRWAAGQWFSLSYSVHRDDSNVYYDSVTINGEETALALSYPAPATTLGEMINPGDQGDGNQEGSPFTWVIDAVSVVAS
jgi:hypothetical protein